MLNITDNTKFHLPDVGKSCTNSITTPEVCKKAAKYFGATYVQATGPGRDLPFGCLLDRLDIDNPLVYLNLEGSVVSEDRNLQPICSN